MKVKNMKSKRSGKEIAKDSIAVFKMMRCNHIWQDIQDGTNNMYQVKECKKCLKRKMTCKY